jgi:epsin
VLDYCLHAGSENVVLYFRDSLYQIKTLKEFQYIDEDGKDQGANVRQKAKDVTNLLQDPSRLREERKSRAHMRDRMNGGRGSEEGWNPDDLDNPRNSRPSRRKDTSKNKDDDELRKAIEESKRTAEADRAKQSEENDLMAAIKLSEEEEAKRSKAVQDSNAKSLFDEQNQQCVFLSFLPLLYYA